MSDVVIRVYEPDPAITRALVVVAHPDDIDFAPVRVDPVTGTVRPNSVGIRQEVSA